jgi:pyruvate dehydrogenase E2 component (dihydrolipoamide acetyltransferase)
MTAEPNAATTPLTGIRRTIARRMTQAWAAPIFHAATSFDTGAAEARRSVVDGASLNDVVLHAVAHELPAHRALNAHYHEDGIIEHTVVNLGFAVALDDGLIVPVIHAADTLDLASLAERRRRLVARARAGTLTHDEVAGGTFTVSSLGMFGIERFDALLNVPQVAILAVGGARPRLQLEGGELVERRSVELTLTVDHRAADGVAAAVFLRDLKARLERESSEAPPR